jgi:hypothetical protein
MTLMVLDGPSAPEGEVVRPTVHVEVAFPDVEPGEKVTLLGADADATSGRMTVAAKVPIAVTPTIAPMSRRDRPRRSRSASVFARKYTVTEKSLREVVRHLPRMGETNPIEVLGDRYGLGDHGSANGAPR